MATIDDIIVEISAKDNGVSQALGKIIQLLSRIDQAVSANNKLLRSMDETSRKTNDAVDKTTKKTVESTKKISDAGVTATKMFKKLKGTIISLVGATAMFALGKKMVNDIVKKDIEIGELSRLTNRTAKDVEGLQNAWKSAGKTAGEANQALSSYSKAVEEFKLTGKFSHPWERAIGYFGSRGFRQVLYDEKGQFRNFEDAGVQLANLWLQKNKGDKKKTEAELVALGMPADQVDVFVHKGQAFIEQKKREATATEASVREAERFNQVFQEMMQKLEALERQLVSRMFPYIERFINWLIELADELQKEPELFWGIATVLGIVAVAFMAVTNPIGTAIAGIGLLLTALWKATNKFEVIKRLWSAIVLMVKESFNGIQGALSWAFRKMGYDDLADAIDKAGYIDTSKEEAVVSAPDTVGQFTGSSPSAGGISGWGTSSFSTGLSYMGQPITPVNPDGVGVGGGIGAGANNSLVGYFKQNNGRGYKFGVYDCSAFTRGAMQNMIKSNPDIYDVKDTALFAGNSGNQIMAVAKKTGGFLSQSSLSPSNIKEGLLIGMDTKVTGWDAHTPYGIDHIVMTIRGGDGRIYVAENSGGRGVHATPASDWMRRWGGKATLYVVDTGRLAKGRVNSGGGSSPMYSAQSSPQIQAGASTSINTTGVRDSGNKDVTVSRVIYCETPQQASQILGIEYANAKRVMSGG